MRHRKKIVKLGRMTSHRKAMLCNMASSLLLHKRIYTTFPKAKAVVPLVHKLITSAKEGTIHARRFAFGILKDRSLVKKLFTEITPTMTNRSSGYTRITKAGSRPGDGAPMALLELISEGAVEEKERKKKGKKK